MAERQNVPVTVVNQQEYDGGPFVFGESYTDGSLDRVLASLQTIRETIPAEYRAAARCEISSVGSWEDTHFASIEVTYERPETDEERDAREADAKSRQALAEAKERAEYERLAARFAKP